MMYDWAGDPAAALDAISECAVDSVGAMKTPLLTGGDPHDERRHRHRADAHSATPVYRGHRCDTPSRGIGVALAAWLVPQYRWRQPRSVSCAFDRLGGV